MKVPTMYAVVTRRLADAMLGETSARRTNPKGKVYGTFATRERAEQYQYENKLGLSTKIVEQ